MDIRVIFWRPVIEAKGTTTMLMSRLLKSWLAWRTGNAALWDPATVHAMRDELYREHLAPDSSVMYDIDALLPRRRGAHENRHRGERNDPDWQALAFTLYVATYGKARQF